MLLLIFWTLLDVRSSAAERAKPVHDLPQKTRQLSVPRVEYTFEEIPRTQKKKCFLEGFFVTEDGSLVESCGLTGKSFLRKYPLNGNGPLLEKEIENVFAEGLVANGDKFWMLTYQAKVIIELDQSFNKLREMRWPFNEGWGFATDGCILFANTGKDFIVHLSMETGKVIKRVPVTKNGESIQLLNEMEYVTPYLWTNVWLTNDIVAIDPETGVIRKTLSLKDLRVQWYGDDTPNGIAYHPKHIGPLSLLVTGKNWDNLYKLTFASAADLCGGPLSASAASEICPQAPRSPCYDTESLPASSVASQPPQQRSAFLVPGSIVDSAVGFVVAMLLVLSLLVLCRAKFMRSYVPINET